MFDHETNKSICQAVVGEDKCCGHSVSGKYPTNSKSHLKKDHPEEFKAIGRKAG